MTHRQRATNRSFLFVEDEDAVRRHESFLISSSSKTMNGPSITGTGAMPLIFLPAMIEHLLAIFATPRARHAVIRLGEGFALVERMAARRDDRSSR